MTTLSLVLPSAAVTPSFSIATASTLYTIRVLDQNDNHNFAFGDDSLRDIDLGGGFDNIAIGRNAMKLAQTSEEVISIGTGSLDAAIESYDSIAIGYDSAGSATFTDSSVIIGSNAAAFSTNVNYSIAIGSSALNRTTGQRNIGLGISAGASLTSGINNIYIGDLAGYGSLSVGSCNVGIGTEALYSISTGDSNIGIGTRALRSNIAENNNIAIGYNAKVDGQEGHSQIIIGANAMACASTVTSDGLIAIGAEVLKYNNESVASFADVMIGYQCASSTVYSGGKNVAVGYQTGYALTTGYENIAVGYRALQNSTTGSENVCIGYLGLLGVTGPYQNVVIGEDAGWCTSNPYYQRNVAIGIGSGAFNETWVEGNVGVGRDTISNLITSTYTTAIGYRAGLYDSAGTFSRYFENSVFIGSSASPASLSSTNEIVIGADSIGKGDNTVHLGNTLTTDTHLEGTVHFTNGITEEEFDISSGTDIDFLDGARQFMSLGAGTHTLSYSNFPASLSAAVTLIISFTSLTTATTITFGGVTAEPDYSDVTDSTGKFKCLLDWTNDEMWVHKIASL